MSKIKKLLMQDTDAYIGELHQDEEEEEELQEIQIRKRVVLSC